VCVCGRGGGAVQIASVNKLSRLILLAHVQDCSQSTADSNLDGEVVLTRQVRCPMPLNFFSSIAAMGGVHIAVNLYLVPASRKGSRTGFTKETYSHFFTS